MGLVQFVIRVTEREGGAGLAACPSDDTLSFVYFSLTIACKTNYISIFSRKELSGLWEHRSFHQSKHLAV
ncbi:hypothetical protein [Anaerotruncus colihominis]|uniref:hypothetical protein n=1 Tax=Anaerotruncus colihominis TaxID=169435 RepID=UPI001898E3AE|nr:hypothetical protein [Anaerotruncus colihominis]